MRNTLKPIISSLGQLVKSHISFSKKNNYLPAISICVSNKYFIFSIQPSLRQHSVHYQRHLTSVSKIHLLSWIHLSEFLDSFFVLIFPPHVSTSVPGHNPQTPFYLCSFHSIDCIHSANFSEKYLYNFVFILQKQIRPLPLKCHPMLMIFVICTSFKRCLRGYNYTILEIRVLNIKLPASSLIPKSK